MYIKVTVVGAGSASLYPTRKIRKIKKTNGSSGSTIVFADGDSVDVTETLAAIYAQQTAGKTLGIILVTEVQEPFHDLTSAARQMIVPTHLIRDVWDKGSGAQINFNDGLGMFVEQTVAAIYAQQAAPTNLGLLRLTRTSDSEVFLVGYHRVLNVSPQGAGSLVRYSNEGTVVVTETVATLELQIN